jgi:hypothetical protein
MYFVLDPHKEVIGLFISCPAHCDSSIVPGHAGGIPHADTILKEDVPNNGFFQEDCAPPHFYTGVRAGLLGSKVSMDIDRQRLPITWSLHSSDLSSLDFPSPHT